MREKRTISRGEEKQFFWNGPAGLLNESYEGGAADRRAIAYCLEPVGVYDLPLLGYLEQRPASGVTHQEVAISRQGQARRFIELF